MPWKSVRRLVAGYIATALSGPRVVIDGTGGTLGQILWFTGEPAETQAAAIHIIPVSPTEAFLKILGPSMGPGTTRIEMHTTGILRLEYTNRLELNSNVQVLANGDVDINTGNVNVDAGDINMPVGDINMGSGMLNVGGPANVNNGQTLTVTGVTELQSDVNVRNTKPLSLYGGQLNLYGGAINLDGGGLTIVWGGIDLLNTGARIKRGNLAGPGFQNGWGNFGGGFANVQYVEYPDHTGGLSGVANAGTLAATMFVLPTAIRPANDHVFVCPGAGNTVVQILVLANGIVRTQSAPGGTTWVGLSGCRWPIAGF